MGDTWPYGGPLQYGYSVFYNSVIEQRGSTTEASILAAIALAESRGDIRVINDTPATEDYSVGAYQVNYYGDLYASRVAQFGTPQQLIEGGVAAQTRAAMSIAAGQGFTAWSTYNDGAYKQYLPGGQPAQPAGTQKQPTPSPPAPIGQGIDSWDGQVSESANGIQQQSVTSLAYSRAIDSI